MLDEFLNLLQRARIHDLAQPYFIGMPHHPAHPPFQFSMSKKHGEWVRPDGGSSALEAIALGGHVGTHIDALCHFSMCGKIYGDVEVEYIQSYAGGIEKHGIETIPPILRRGVLLDIARAEGVDTLPEDFAIDAAVLERVADRQEVEIRPGDVVLVRTGWAQFWNDQKRYINQLMNPGVHIEGARWLSAKGIFAGGSDTVGFELAPSDTMPVHIHFLVEKGIHIIELLNMETLSNDKSYEFAFIAAPLKIVGATGAPIRPLAAAL
jgi:kynurenine formamidase